MELKNINTADFEELKPYLAKLNTEADVTDFYSELTENQRAVLFENSRAVGILVSIANGVNPLRTIPDSNLSNGNSTSRKKSNGRSYSLNNGHSIMPDDDFDYNDAAFINFSSIIGAVAITSLILISSLLLQLALIP